MARIQLQSSCSTERLCSGVDMSSPTSRPPSTKFKSKGRLLTGKFQSFFFCICANKVQSVFLVTVHDPVCTEDGNLENALYGSFLPIPSTSAFPITPVEEYASDKLPGAVIAKKERIVINRDRKRIALKVTNNGDRPIQVCVLLQHTRGPQLNRVFR